jgi:hypothetical protein
MKISFTSLKKDLNFNKDIIHDQYQNKKQKYNISMNIRYIGIFFKKNPKFYKY